MNLGLMVWVYVFAATLFIENATAQSPLDSALQPMMGTLSTRAEPLLSEGKLQGCTMVFNILMTDTKYDLGAYLRIEGNFGILAQKERVGANLKVVVNKLVAGKTGFVLEPRKPSRAYLIARDFSTSQGPEAQSFDGETPGSLFVVFDVGRGMDFANEVLSSGKLDLAFNQNAGNSDLRTTIDFGVVDFDNSGQRIRSKETMNRFSECLLALGDRLK